MKGPNMKKVIVSASALLLVLVCLFAACTKPVAPVNADITAKELWEKVSAVAGYGAMTAVPERDYLDVYGIDASKLADSAWYMSENPSLNADECAIFKLEDASYAETLAGLLKDRLARQLTVAETYSPDEAGKLKNAEVVTAGSFVYYCVGNNAEAMMNTIRTAVK